MRPSQEGLGCRPSLSLPSSPLLRTRGSPGSWVYPVPSCTRGNEQLVFHDRIKEVEETETKTLDVAPWPFFVSILQVHLIRSWKVITYCLFFLRSPSRLHALAL